MLAENFVTDMAVESVSRAKVEELMQNKTLQCGIVQRYLNLKDITLAKEIGKACGAYMTYDCPYATADKTLGDALEKYMSKCILEFIGILKRQDPVLVVGLGNDEVVADSLGCRTVSQIAVNRQNYGTFDIRGQCLCALSAGVYGATGIRSIEVVKSIVREIAPCAVIVVDSLATASVGRLGASYQLSTVGIAPGSGVSQNKERIDKSVLGVPVVAIGVPLVLSMRTLVSGFVDEFLNDLGCKNDEYSMRAKLTERKLNNLVVAPKEIKFMVDFSSSIIASAINRAFVK